MAKSFPFGHGPATDLPAVNYREVIRMIDRFFEGRDEIHKTMRRLVKRLGKAQISYAIMGAMALAAHRYRRVTTDLDVLVTEEGLRIFRRLHVPKNYTQQPGRPRRFIDRKNDISIDFLVTGRFPGRGQPGPIAFPDPSAVGETFADWQVVNLPTLIDLKLAARRFKDFGDVVELIRANDLDESYLERLHPSVRQDFIECLEEKRREDEYDSREEPPGEEAS
jgi:hypothetical protein